MYVLLHHLEQIRQTTYEQFNLSITEAQILTLAVIACPQDNKNIFNEWNESKRVDNKRECPDNLLCVFYLLRKDVVENIKRRCA